MTLLLAVVAGVLFSGGIYMILRRSLVKVIVGVLLLSYAVNLLLFDSAVLVAGYPPLIPANQSQPPEVYADPVTQALILTAIVISFGVTAFVVVLIKQVYLTSHTDDLNQMRCTDIPCLDSELSDSTLDEGKTT